MTPKRMTQAQRRVVLEAYERANATLTARAERGFVRPADTTRVTTLGWLTADPRTEASLLRHGWSVKLPGKSHDYVTRAGLIAAGVDMDALHADASAENVERDRPGNTCMRMDGDHAWHGYARIGEGCLDLLAVAPAEALAEDERWTIHVGTFRESCAQHDCPGCPTASAPLRTGDSCSALDEQYARDAHSSAYWERATQGLPREPAF